MGMQKKKKKVNPRELDGNAKEEEEGEPQRARWECKRRRRR